MMPNHRLSCSRLTDFRAKGRDFGLAFLPILVLFASAPGEGHARGTGTMPPLAIAPQRLITALADLGRQAQVEILLKAPGLESRQVAGVQGALPARRAIERLVRGLPVQVRQIGPRLYMIEPRLSRPTRGEPSGQPAATPAPEAFPIAVIARRRAEAEQDVPLMINRLGAEELSVGAVRTLADLARVVPGFVATGQTSSAAPLLVMRGQRRSISDENRLPLAVYLDEVPLPNQATLSPLYDIASVEILRGPQGTLFGRNTTSGAVLVQTAPPGKGIPSYVELDGGNHGLRRVEGALDLRLSSVSALRLSGQRMRRKGFMRLASGGRADDVHSDALRLSYRFAPDDRFSSTTSFDLLNADEKGSALVLAGVYSGGDARNAANAPYYDCGAGVCDVDSYYAIQQQLGGRVSQAGLEPLFRRRFRSLSNVTEYGDDRFKLRNIASWRSTRMNIALDGDGTPLAINDIETSIDLRQWTEEAQAQGKIGRLQYIGGFFYLDSAPAGAMLQKVAQYVRPDNPASFIANYQYFRSAALFGQVTLDLGQGRSVDVGGRYTWENAHGCSLRSPEAQPRSYAACLLAGGSAARSRAGRFTWTLSANQRVGEALFYLTNRRAFRSGGYNSPTLGEKLAAFQRFEPETLTDVEAGVKGAWSSGRVRARYALAAYMGFYHNIQRALFPAADFDGDGIASNDPITLYVNIARARIGGVDADFSATLGGRTRLMLSGAYVDARYTRMDVPQVLAGLIGTDRDGYRFSYTPRFSATASFFQGFALPVGWGEEIELGVDYSYNSRVRFAERANEGFAYQPGYGLLGASIRWREVAGRPIELELWGRNLTDRSYISGGGTLNPVYTTATIIAGPPRTFGLRLRYNFH